MLHLIIFNVFPRQMWKPSWNGNFRWLPSPIIICSNDANQKQRCTHFFPLIFMNSNQSWKNADWLFNSLLQPPINNCRHTSDKQNPFVGQMFRLNTTTMVNFRQQYSALLTQNAWLAHALAKIEKTFLRNRINHIIRYKYPTSAEIQ